MVSSQGQKLPPATGTPLFFFFFPAYPPIPPVSSLQLEHTGSPLSGTHRPIRKLTRESSADDDVVILRVAIKNKVLIGGILEGKSHLCPLKTGRNYRLWLEGTGCGRRGCSLLSACPTPPVLTERLPLPYCAQHRHSR